jgi:sortase B
MKKQKMPFWICYFLCTIALIISLYKITVKQIHYKLTSLEEEELRSKTVITEVDDKQNAEDFFKEKVGENYDYYINIPFLNTDFGSLISENSDTVAWLEVKNTNINYPVVQASDNDYYLTHSFDKSYNEAGWVFLDFRNHLDNLLKNTIIYGHGMNNGTIFGSLKEVVTESWLTNLDNHIIRLSTPKENYTWQIFSVYTIEEENYYIKTAFKDNTDYEDFLTTLQERSIYDFQTTLDSADNILTLSSCYNDYLRVVIHARLLKKQTRD